MATGGGGSISRSSEPFHDFSCSVCDKDDKHTEGGRFCVECNEIFCIPCLVFHNKIAIMRQHELLTQDQMIARKPQLHLVQLPTSRCTVHPGQVISMYCGQDDVVCCTVCIAEDHRSCEGVIYIPRKAINIQASQEFMDVNAAIGTMTADIEIFKKDKQLDLDRLNAQHQRIQVCIGEIRDQLNKHLDHLEELARDELEKKFKVHEDEITDYLAKLEKQLSKLEDIADKLKNVKNESQLFVDMKIAKAYEKDGKKICADIEKTVGKPAIHLIPNKEIFNLLKQKSIGTVEDTKQLDSVVHLCDFNVKTNNDSNTCVISGLCQMLDGNILMADIENEKLKLMDTSYKVVEECMLPGPPYSVCRTSPTEVAITMCVDKRVVFAKVTAKITLNRSFNIGDACRCIAYNKGLLFVACEGLKDNGEGMGKVNVYDMSGNHLQSYLKDKNDKILFSVPLAVSVIESKTTIHIADRDSGIVSINIDESGPWKFTKPDMKWTQGICLVNNDDLIFCGYDSDNVIMYDKKGQRKAVMFKENNGIKQLGSVLYDKINSTLIVSMNKCNKIRVYILL